MKHPNIRIARLKEMIALEEKRATLQTHTAAVNERLAIIQSELYGAGAAREQKALAQKASVKQQPKAQRKGRGELKGQILEMLDAAGKVGVSVKELADRIGIKTANIHSWFSANLNKLTGLKKVGEARYALNGTAVVALSPAKKGKVAKKAKAVKEVKAPKKAKVAKAAKAPKAVKAPKVAKVVKASKAVKAPKAAKVVKTTKVARSGRGQLKAQILEELKNVGAEGITIKDLAAKLNANYKNVYIWFVTTGKKIAGITKVGPAQYRLEAA